MSRPDPQRGSPALPRPERHGALAPQRPAAPAPQRLVASAPQHPAAPAPQRPVAPAPSDQAWMLMVDLVVATLTWGGIGWLLDRWLGSGPWLMSLGFVVGNGAGIYLLWLRTNHAAGSHAAGGHAAGGHAASGHAAGGHAAASHAAGGQAAGGHAAGGHAAGGHAAASDAGAGYRPRPDAPGPQRASGPGG